MNLSDYRKDRSLSQAAFAELLTAAGSKATQALISQWEAGEVRIPAERMIAIESVTDGAVTRHDLRPDIFGAAPAPAESEKAA